MSNSPSSTSINKNVNNTQKTVGSKRKRRDRILERPNYRFAFFLHQQLLRFDFV